MTIATKTKVSQFAITSTKSGAKVGRANFLNGQIVIKQSGGFLEFYDWGAVNKAVSFLLVESTACSLNLDCGLTVERS